MKYAQDFNLDEFEDSISNLFRSKSQNNSYYYKDRISLNKALRKLISKFDFFDHERFNKRDVITYVLEKYADLSLAEREKVFCYPQYKTITECIDNSEFIIIKNINGKLFEVKPYILAVDDNSYSYYLIGYSRIKGSNNDFKCYPFKLIRIIECESNHREFALSKKEKQDTNVIFKKFGAAYMIPEVSVEKTVIRLTEDGYRELFLKVITHQRPIPIQAPVAVTINGIQYYELIFDCSYQQIRNYFFSFGAEAEILSPKPLRDKFINDYQSATKLYLKQDI